MSDEQKNQQNNENNSEQKKSFPQKQDSGKKPSDEKDKKQNPQDFDPYSFFKLSIDEPEGDGKNKNGKKPPKFPFFTMLAVTVLTLALINMFLLPKADGTIPFSEFRKLVEDGTIVYVEMGENSFTGYGSQTEPAGSVSAASEDGEDSLLKTPQLPWNRIRRGQEEGRKVYRTTGVLMQDFVSLLNEKGVEYKFVIKQTNWLVQLLLNFAFPIGLLLLMYFFIFRRIGGGMGGGMGSLFGNGGGRAKTVEEGKVKTRFADVAGVDEAKEELVEVVDFLKEPKKYTDIGGKIPKGVLLVGPPGTGKTLLARAVAGEAGVPFFSISGSDFVEMFVGVGASRVRDLFRQAREKAPCIIFIDEIDALGKSRMNGYGGGNDEREQTLNQLLVEMDGFDNEKGLIILAATNRADILDPALLRPGRFDRQVPVEKPDVKGREDILRIHSKNVKLDKDVDFVSVAHGTVGFAGADLANVVNEAALMAVRNGRKKVTMEDFNEAIDKVSIGLKKKSRKDNKKEMRLVSVHETGHALVAAFTSDFPPVNKITVVPRSHGVGGFTQYREEEEKNFMTRSDIINEVDSCLGGRAAEEVMLGDISTGASNDIARATDLVKRMITDFGMSEKFRNMTLGKGVLGHQGADPNIYREFSEETQRYVDEEIARIMDERYAHVRSLMEEHKDLLNFIANRLLEIETMDGKEFYEIVKGEAHCRELAQQAAENAENKPEELLSKEQPSDEQSSENQPAEAVQN